jgi:PAS domain S-box-containing protein
MLHTDGDQFWARLEAAVVQNADGTLLCRVIISDITARKQAEQALQLQHDLSLKLNSTFDLYQALGFILDTVLQLDSIDCGGIYVEDPASGDLDLVVYHGLSPQFVELTSHFPSDSPNVQLARTGEVRLIDDADLRLLVDDLRQLEGLHAVAIIPVLYQGQLLAVLNLASHTHDAIPDSTRSTSEILALQIGSALMRVRSRIALQESEARYRLLVENQKDLVVKTDLEGRFLYANPAYYELFGVAEGELLGKTYTPLVHPDDLPVVEKAVAALFEPPFECSYEERASTRHGWRWLSWTARSVLDEQGEVTALIGSAQDITERKQAEEQVKQSLREKEILLRELNHRVKNNMHVISALLNLQASYTDNDEVKTMFADLHNRIQAMSLVHEKLYQSPDLSRIDLQDYVEDLVYLILTGNLSAVDRISLVLDIEPIQVSMDIAIPFGMILNELISNAMKHAFPDERSGGIRLRLLQEQGVIELDYADNGIGVPEGFDFRRQQSLGMQTIIALAERQLGGTATFRSQQGINWSIRFPDRL